MSYLKFDKTLMINLEQSLLKEMLRTNKSGAYSFSTIVDCNTRKQQGLFVIPIPELDGGNHVLISSLDATIIQHGAEFNLGLHKYPGDNYSPKGHKYIREYECDYNPKTIYRVGGVILSREVIFVSHENRLLIKYTLIEAHSPTTLRLKPFLAFRNTMTLSKENSKINKEYQTIENGIKVCLYEGYPDLHMQMSRKNIFMYGTDWYRNIEYMKDQEQFYDFQEDLFVPGFFEIPIKKGESIIFSAGTSPLASRKMQNLFEKETRKITNDPATAKEDKSTPNKFRIPSPTNRNIARVRNETTATLAGKSPPFFCFKSTITGMEPVMSMIANSTTNALAISFRSKSIFILTVYCLSQK